MKLPFTFDRPQSPAIAQWLGYPSMDVAWDKAQLFGSNAGQIIEHKPALSSGLRGLSSFISYEGWVPDRIKLKIRAEYAIPGIDRVNRISYKADVNAAFLPAPKLRSDGRIEQGGAAPWEWVATGTAESVSDEAGTQRSAFLLAVYPMATPVFFVVNERVRWDGARWIIPKFLTPAFAESYDVQVELTPPIRLR